MKFPVLLKFAYVSFPFQCKICWWGEMTGFIKVYKLINGIFNYLHKFTVSTYTGMSETIILDQIIKSRQIHTFETWQFRADWSLEGWFSSHLLPWSAALLLPPTFTFAAVPLTLLTFGVCGNEFSLPTCGVVWPATLTQLLHFTEGETEAQRAFLNSVLITVLRLHVEFLNTVF